MAAVQLKAQTPHEVLWIAEHIETSELCEVFRARPDVRLILGAYRLSIPAS